MTQSVSSPSSKYSFQPDNWRKKMYVIIFEADTRAGRTFDVILVLAILASLGVVMLDSVYPVRQQYGQLLDVLEWIFTTLFTVEYVLRLLCVPKALRYAYSFYGVIDFLAILPSYVALLVPGTHLLIDIRILRLLRIFRIFKLSHYLKESQILIQALIASRHKIAVFISAVLIFVVILATLMYVLEGPANGFTSIPRSIYWAIVTITTTGYGDITPRTDLGQVIATMVMLLGYGILAVPTGIVSAEITARALRSKPPTTRTCTNCLTEGHDVDAAYCKYCGEAMLRYEYE